MSQDQKDQPNNKLVYPNPLIIDASSTHTATVIWIHGLGDTGNGWYGDMLKMSKSFDYIKFILPTAPTRSITCNAQMMMPGWYDIESTQNRNINKYKGKDDSSQYIHSLIKNEIKSTNISSSRIIIAGFSQGGAMSIYAGLLSPVKLAAIICCSGYLLDFKKLIKGTISKLINKDVPIFMFHAEEDEVVPTDHAKKSCQHLKTSGVNITWKEYNILDNGGHWVSDQEMNDVQNKISAFLPKI